VQRRTLQRQLQRRGRGGACAPPPHAAVRFARVRPSILLIALLASLGGVLAGCGSSSPTGTAGDPASIVPAAAALYAGATVRPSGQEQTAALAAGKALTHKADPYLQLLAVLQAPGSPQLSYKRDVAPWLGPHAGLFLTSASSSASALLSLVKQGLLGGSASSAFPFGAGGVQGAIVLDTSNLADARSFVETQARHAGAHTSAYRGISYQASSDGVAFAVVDKYVVIGSEAGVHAVIDTSLGASSLVHASGYAKLLAAAPADSLAHIYSNPEGSTHRASSESTSGLLGLLAGAHQANISLIPSATSLTLDADTLDGGEASPSAAGGLLASDPESAQALAELPGESWLAIGLGHVGDTLSQDVQGLQTLTSLGSTLGGGGPESSAGISLSGLVQGLTTPLGELGANTPQARKDFASWMGSAGIFASGASLLELHGAVVITSSDPALSRAAVGKLASELRKAGGSVSAASIPGTEAAVGARLSGLPVVLDIADGRDSSGQTKFVLGIGEASVEQALNPSSTLATASTRAAAATAIGENTQPSLIVSFPTLVSLLEGLGLTESPSISKFVPYLRAATTLAGGGHNLSGEVSRFRLAFGLQPPSEEASG
jgi:Protein of unknown function (DUF3352)